MIMNSYEVLSSMAAINKLAKYSLNKQFIFCLQQPPFNIHIYLISSMKNLVVHDADISLYNKMVEVLFGNKYHLHDFAGETRL